MPVCEECGDPFDAYDVFAGSDATEVQRLYRAIADGEPKMELLHMMFEMFGQRCELAPPATELRVAKMCDTRQEVRRHG